MAVKKLPPPVEQPRLRAVTAPVDTFSRPAPAELPPDAPVRSDLARLAVSLGSFSEQLGEWGKAKIREEGRFGESEAMGLRLRTTTDELGTRIRSGDIPPQVNSAVLNMGHGEDLARQHFQDIRRRYQGESTSGNPLQSNAFDRNGGDVDGWFRTISREYEGQLPQNPYVLHSWRRMMTGFQEKLYQEHDGYLAQRTTNANLDAAHRDFYGVATTAITEGERDPAAIHGRMQGAFTRTSQLYRLTPEQTNAALFTTARAIAEQGIPGNPMLGVGLVREMLLARRGQNGEIPPLGESHQYAHQANQVIEAAQKTAGELQRKQDLETIVPIREDAQNGRLDERRFIQFTRDNPHILRQPEIESILLQNRAALTKALEEQRKVAEKLRLEAISQASEAEVSHMLREHGEAGTLLNVPEKVEYTKPNGEPAQYSRRALLDRAAEEELRRIDEWSRQQRDIEQEVQDRGAVPVGLSVEQRKFDREFEYFNRNQLVHPQWRDMLDRGYAAASPDQLAANAPAPVLLQSVQLFEQLQARSPGLLERHLHSNSAKDFYTTYRVARTLMGQDERQALLTAAVATKSLGGDDSHAIPFKRLEEEIGKPSSIWPWAASINNSGEMREDIRRLGRALVRGGLGPDQAARAAGDEVRRQYTNINGYMVKTSDRHVESYGALLRSSNLEPRTFPDSVNRFLTKYAAVSPDASDSYTVDDPTSPSGQITVSRRHNLSIRPTTEGFGMWAVVDATTGHPVPSTNGMRQVISLRDLLEFERTAQTEAREALAARLAEEGRATRQNEAQVRAERKEAVRKLALENLGAPPAPAHEEGASMPVVPPLPRRVPRLGEGESGVPARVQQPKATPEKLRPKRLWPGDFNPDDGG